MPITLGCPSCGKRFRAREESSGKKVKCPFCQAAVPVPSGEGQSADQPHPTAPAQPMPSTPFLSSHPPMVTRPAPPTAPVPAASADAWGAEPQQKADSPQLPALSPPPPSPLMEQPLAFAPVTTSRPLPTPGLPPVKPKKAAKSPEEQIAAAWRKASGGLRWVLFGLFFFALMAIVPVGKIVYERTGNKLPAGDGAEWIKVDGYINQGNDAVQLSKEDFVDLGAYGVPVLLGGLFLSLGRVTAGAAPRNSGSKGLFAFSGLITLLALAGVMTYVVCERVAYREYANYGKWAAIIGGGLGEFWFLLGLAAAGATLRRPATVRTVGAFALVVGVAIAIYYVGWDAYLQHLAPKIGRPKSVEPGSDWQFYEAAAKLLGWLIVIGTYWRAVRGVRSAIKEFAEE